MKKQLKNIVLHKFIDYSFATIRLSLKKHTYFILFLVLSFSVVGQSDEIDDEVDDDISTETGGLSEEDLFEGISNTVKSKIKGMIANAISSSPIAEVASLRKVINEGLSRQNKIAKANLELEVEHSKAYLTISKELSTYYKSLNFNTSINEVKTSGNQFKVNASKFKYLPKTTVEVFNKKIDVLMNLSRITKDIKIVTNQDEDVWMSESERIDILDLCKKKINERNADVASLYYMFFDLNNDNSKISLRRKKLKNLTGIK